MVFLPGTAVATIFAMPIFDWKARWWNIYADFDPQSSQDISSSSTGESSTDPGPGPVLSGYFWIYLAVSLFLTLVSIFLFFFYLADWKLEVNPFRSTWSAVKSLYRRVAGVKVGDGAKLGA